jgi:hypothetical protein
MYSLTFEKTALSGKSTFRPLVNVTEFGLSTHSGDLCITGNIVDTEKNQTVL